MHLRATQAISVSCAFYEVLVRKLCKVLVRYRNIMHRVGVYGAHGVWCTNFLTKLVLSHVERTGAFYGDKSTR